MGVPHGAGGTVAGAVCIQRFVSCRTVSLRIASISAEAESAYTVHAVRILRGRIFRALRRVSARAVTRITVSGPAQAFKILVAILGIGVYIAERAGLPCRHRSINEGKAVASTVHVHRREPIRAFSRRFALRGADAESANTVNTVGIIDVWNTVTLPAIAARAEPPILGSQTGKSI